MVPATTKERRKRAKAGKGGGLAFELPGLFDLVEEVLFFDFHLGHVQPASRVV